MLFGGSATIRLILDGAGVEVVVLFNVLLLLRKDNSVVVLGTSGSKFLLVLGIDDIFLVQGKKLLVLGMDEIVLVQGKKLLVLISDDIVWVRENNFEITGKEGVGGTTYVEKRVLVLTVVILFKVLVGNCQRQTEAPRVQPPMIFVRVAVILYPSAWCL